MLFRSQMCGTSIGGIDRATISPRAATSLRLSVPLADHVWLDGAASLTIVAAGHTDPFSAAGTVDPDPGANPLSLPGEPATLWQLGVGLRIGVP